MTNAPAGGVPQLQTARLRLRAHRPDDLAACHALWANPEVVRYIGGKPASREETWRRMLGYAGLWSLLSFGYWAIEDSRTGGYGGDIGLAEFERDITPPLRGLLEFGWVLTPAAHGQGMASEAVAVINDWRRARLPEQRAACIIAPENRASIRVAEKAGFQRCCETVYHGAATLVFTDPPVPAPAR